MNDILVLLMFNRCKVWSLSAAPAGHILLLQSYHGEVS